MCTKYLVLFKKNYQLFFAIIRIQLHFSSKHIVCKRSSRVSLIVLNSNSTLLSQLSAPTLESIYASNP